MSTIRQDKIRSHYDSIADTYDHHYDCHRGRHYHTHISSYLIKALPERGHLLDIGCGTGLFIEKYLKTGGTAVGLDISSKMVERAQCRLNNCAFAVGNGETLPFKDNTFEGISSLLVFSYVRDPYQMLSEAFRVLRPGGSIAICTLGKKLITKGIPALYQLSEKMNVNHVVMKNFGEHYYDEAEMRTLFDATGFDNIAIRWCSFAHIDMADPVYKLASQIEPFVERRIPQLAFNIFVSGKKPAD